MRASLRHDFAPYKQKRKSRQCEWKNSIFFPRSKIGLQSKQNLKILECYINIYNARENVGMVEISERETIYIAI